MKTTTFTVSGSHSLDAGSEITIVSGGKVSKRFVIEKVNDASTVTLKKISWWTLFMRNVKAIWGKLIDRSINALLKMKPTETNQRKNNPFPYLSVGDLRVKIQDLPSDMPVLYEDIEDTLDWEKFKLKTGQIWVGDKNIDGTKIYEDQYGEFIEAFTGYEIDGKFVITAHY